VVRKESLTLTHPQVSDGEFGQPTRVLISMVYLFGGEESKAKNSKVAHEYAKHREHSEFILVRASEE
jgi:hypothetical protein